MPKYKDLTDKQKEQVQAIALAKGQPVERCFDDIQRKALARYTGANKGAPQ